MPFLKMIFVGACAVSILYPSISKAQQMYGLFMIVKGDVTYKNPNSPSEKAKVGAKVFEGAMITTEKDSRAKIVMADRNVFNLSPESKLTIQKYENSDGKKNVSMSLQEGKVRVNVEQKYDGAKEKFLLKTPTVVAGVRGTQFLAGYDSSSKTSQVTTFKGAVAMTSFSSNGQPISTVRVEKGQTSSAQLNRPPDAPKTVPAQELKDLDRATASSGTEKKSDQANSGGTKLASSKEVDTDMAKEIKPIAGETSKGEVAILLPPAPPPPPPPPPPVPRQFLKTAVIINVQ